VTSCQRWLWLWKSGPWARRVQVLALRSEQVGGCHLGEVPARERLGYLEFGAPAMGLLLEQERRVA